MSLASSISCCDGEQRDLADLAQVHAHRVVDGVVDGHVEQARGTPPPRRSPPAPPPRSRRPPRPCRPGASRGTPAPRETGRRPGRARPPRPGERDPCSRACSRTSCRTSAVELRVVRPSQTRPSSGSRFVRLARTLWQQTLQMEELALLLLHVAAFVQTRRAERLIVAAEILLLKTQMELLEHRHRDSAPGRPP